MNGQRVAGKIRQVCVMGAWESDSQVGSQEHQRQQRSENEKKENVFDEKISGDR